mmetsp:Transcript_84189/g.238874  ORF Transcript_84189/g.238874 Transcript_84189/m.238874 type:complete len:211 (+) Transcript_84189:334-966(+)
MALEPELNVLSALVPRIEAVKVSEVKHRTQDRHSLRLEVGAVQAERIHGGPDARLAHDQHRRAGRLRNVSVVDPDNRPDRRETDTIDDDDAPSRRQCIDTSCDPVDPLRTCPLVPCEERPREALVKHQRCVLARHVFDPLLRAPLCEEVWRLTLCGGLDVRKVCRLEPAFPQRAEDAQANRSFPHVGHRSRDEDPDATAACSDDCRGEGI